MDTPTLVCESEKRRHQVRESEELNGLDFIEVREDQLKLTIHLLRKASEQLQDDLNGPNRKRHVVIEGGRRITTVLIEDVRLEHTDDPSRDDKLGITVIEPGDFSIYTLRLAELDEAGRPTANAMTGIDPRYAEIKFSFKEHCPTDLDCKTPKICPPSDRELPDINYLAKDYASFRQLILDRLSQIMPAWQERHVPDLGITLVEILAYVGDYLSYNQDAVGTEAYLDTARQRISMRRHARMVDYAMHEGCNARAWLFIQTSQDTEPLEPEQIYFITQLRGALENEKIIPDEEVQAIPKNEYQVFEPLLELPEICEGQLTQGDEGARIQLYKAHNEICFYTWGDTECCLPKGTTFATLWDHDCQSIGTPSLEQSKSNPNAPPEPQGTLKVKRGDILLLEELKDPKTGNPADADVMHRHFVRLTDVKRYADPLNQQPVIDIEWDEEDALPFPLCLSAIGPAPKCQLIDKISVARGNIILVDHGQRIPEKEDLGSVNLKDAKIVCEHEEFPSEAVLEPELFQVRLRQAPLTFSQPLVPKTSATKTIEQNPRFGVSQIELSSNIALPGGPVEKFLWQPKRDLMGSDRDARHFVVEMDNEGRARLRFGDGKSGRRPEVGEVFEATYRVGIGLAGNVGAVSISHVVARTRELLTKLSDVKLRPRNPLPATGGIEPEPLQEVKMFAPTTFRRQLERAITPEDYRRLAERHPKVQRAAATFLWTGSWYEVLVAIDPFGKVEAEQELLDQIAISLERYRRMGQDVVVKRALFVPLDILMEVCVLPEYLRGHVKADLLRFFSSKVLSDGTLGFFHPDNLTFGQAVRLSNLVAIAQKVPGVESVNIARFERLFEGPNNELENGILQLSPLEIARLDSDPNFPENGRLELIMRGGR